MKNVIIIKNPLISEAMGKLRDKNTNRETFRHYSDQLTYILISNALADLPTVDYEINTPIGKTTAQKIEKDMVFVVVLRSGVVMLDAALAFLPFAAVGFAGIYREESTAFPQEYYWKMPTITKKTRVCIIDPMLATGGTALLVMKKLAKYLPQEIRLISIVAAPEGIDAVHAKFPDSKIFLAALDNKLNKQKFIVPGLGDFGDRYFGTTS